MSVFKDMLPGNFISAAGWAIFHSLWQGFIIAIILSILLLLINKNNARIRGLISFGALSILFASVINTFVNYYNTSPDKINSILFNSIKSNFSENSSQLNTNQISANSNFLESIELFFRQNVEIIVMLWFLGVVFFLIKFFGGFLYSQRLKKHKTNEVDNKYFHLVKKLSNLLEIDKKVNIFESALVKVPVVIGYFKPVILFPLGLLSGLPQNQIEVILLHELAHIKRADYLLNIFQSFIEVILFYHPAVWWISSVIRNERENDCDDLAISINEENITLAKALLNVSQYSINNNKFELAAVGSKNQLLRRVKRMTRGNNNLIKSITNTSFVIITLFLGLTLYACSSGNDAMYYSDDDFDFVDEGSTFEFREDGDRYRVKFEDGKIFKLYKNGIRIDEDEFDKYEEMINDRKDELDKDAHHLRMEAKKLKEEMHELNGSQKHKLKRELGKIKRELRRLKRNKSHNHFDREKFEESMEELTENLSNLKFNFKFDHDFDNQLNFNYDIDSDDFEEDLESFLEDIKNIKIDIDTEDFENINIELGNVADAISDIDINLDDLKVELKKLAKFVKILKKELVSDGYIDEYDDDFEIDLDEDSLYVNDKKLSSAAHQKYKELYEDYFDKKLSDNNRFRMNH